VEGVRLVHATFAMGVLLSMYVLLQRVISPWWAALACIALALDPSFSFSFRTQAYITVAPTAWIFLGIYSLLRASTSPESTAARWVFASGVLCGLSAVGYFVWAFLLPPVAFFAVRSIRGVALARPAWVIWSGGVLCGAAAYPIGYLLVARKAGSLDASLAVFSALLGSASPLHSQLDVMGRTTFIASNLVSVLDGSWHSGMMFNGDSITVPTVGLKLAILLGLPLVLWVIAEARHLATPLQRLFLGLPLSFGLCGAIFGDRLGGHHFAILVPVLYAGLAVALGGVFGCAKRSWVIAGLSIPLFALACIGAAAQVTFGEKLVLTGGKGLLSDAIHHFAADLNATQSKPLLWFPDAVLALPLIMLSHGEVEMVDQLDDPEPRRRLCSGNDVWLVRIPGHPSARRGEQWLAILDWSTPPALQVYAQRDGTPVFEVLRFKGSRQACRAPPP